MAGNYYDHSLNFALQAGKIKSLFPDSKLNFDQNRLVWTYSLTPSPLSCTYDVKLIYKRGEDPNVFVINPKLKLYPGETKLPHVYNTDKQWLCLYFRRAREWRSSMLIANTVISWTCEWLVHYELWVGTGNWGGGGIHLENEVKITDNKNQNQKWPK